MSVLVETSLGDIVVDLFCKRCPNTCRNFLKLCKVKYYNGCIFHNIQKDFIIQTGDPTATGRGGESIYGLLYGEQAKYFEDEIRPSLRHKRAGTLSMANAGQPNTNGSQFLITTRDNIDILDEKNAVFGEVAEGMDTVQRINEAFCDNEGMPYQIIRIHHTIVLHDPFPDPPGLEVPDQSPMRTVPDFLKNRLEEGEEIDEEADKRSKEEMERKQQELDARSRAEVLEMIGDLPVADVKPPDNVLFLCKLNPVTTSEDLEIIFSRFGNILSCEVIRDPKTDDSLCYAFVEFETVEQCEAAYLKMDNVLIDDRRIHVDFSQSVSRLRQKYGVYDTGFFGDRYRQYVTALAISEDDVDQLQDRKFDDRRVKSRPSGRGGGRGRPFRGRGGPSGRGRGDDRSQRPDEDRGRPHRDDPRDKRGREDFAQRPIKRERMDSSDDRSTRRN